MCLKSARGDGVTGLSVDSKDRSDGDETVDVGGTVQRVEAHNVFPLWIKEKKISQGKKEAANQVTMKVEVARTCLSDSTTMALSSSSETRTQEEKEDLSMLMTRSLDRTSSFFTWSPVTLVLPAMP